MNQSRILIAEDEMIARENLTHVLTRRGAEVVAVENGRKAMQALSGGEFDLVVSDLRMPDMDGMQLLEHVKSTVPDTEVIIITGYASIETAVEAMRKGAYQYLAKPIRLDEVCVMAEKALEKRRLRQEVDSLRRPEGIRCAHYHRAEPRRACAQGEYCPGRTGGLHSAHSR